jgi:predicted deacetylase
VGAIVNLGCYDECPQLMQEFRRRGYEIIAHGYTNADRQVRHHDRATDQGIYSTCMV